MAAIWEQPGVGLRWLLNPHYYLTPVGEEVICGGSGVSDRYSKTKWGTAVLDGGRYLLLLSGQT